VHIESGANQSADKRDRRKQPLGMKVQHAMIPNIPYPPLSAARAVR
jgi:hypothetical protein